VEDTERLDYSLLALPQHLHEAEDWQRLNRLLTTFLFLDQKNRRFGPQAVAGDFELTELASLAVVRDAIRLAAHVAGTDGDQLAGQLIARLMDRPEAEVCDLVRQAQAQRGRSWLRPLAQTLPSADGPLRRTLRGHNDCVHAVVASPDGRFVISGGGSRFAESTRPSDQTIRVWNVDTGHLERILDGHDENINALAIAPDGMVLISASSDGTLAVWDLASGLRQRVIHVDGGGVLDVAITPNGRGLVSASEDGRITLWSMRSGSEIHTMQGHSSAAQAVAVTPDGKLAISGSVDKTVRIWNLVKGCLIRTLCGHSETVWTVAVSPDGRQLASGAGFIYGPKRDTTVRLWDLATGAMTRILKGHGSAVNSVVFSADGGHLLSASADGTLREWDCATGEELHSARASSGHVSTIINAVAVLPGIGRVVTCSNDMTVKVWDLTRRPAQPNRYAHEGAVSRLLFTPDGKRLISGASDLKVWEVETGRQQRLRGKITDLHDMALTPDGTRLLAVQADASVTISELSSGTTVLRLPSPDGHVVVGQRRIAVTADGLHFVVSSAHDLKLRDLSDGTVIASLPGFEDMNCFAVTADGRSVLAGSDDHRTRLWTPAESQELTLPRSKIVWPDKPESEIDRLNPTDRESVGTIRVDRAGRRALALYQGGAVEVWNLRKRQSELVLYPHDERVTEVLLTADGDTAITSSSDRTVKIWDLTRNELVRTFEEHDGEVEHIAVHGRMVLSVSDDDGQAILWNMDSGRVAGRFTADGPLVSCAIAPDGGTFALGELSGRVHLLRLSG
jgi:WD40 repeat protein